MVLIKGEVGVVVVNRESALYLHSGSFKVPGRLLTRWRKLHSTTNKIIWGSLIEKGGWECGGVVNIKFLLLIETVVLSNASRTPRIKCT